MSGLWGYALADPRARAEISDLAVMGLARGQDQSLPMHAVGVGPAAIACREFPGHAAAIARRAIGDAQVVLALFGTVFDLEGHGASNGQPEASDLRRVAETLTDAYLAVGPDLWTRIRGDFIVAVWDGRDGALRIVCDPFRVHPLFYAADRHSIVFGSRLASILARPGAPPYDVDPESVLEVLVASVIPTPATIYRGIHKLPPGTELTYRSGHVTLRRYWDFAFDAPGGISEATLAADLKERLEDSVRVRLKGDRDSSFGAFLSGGIDSTTVLGLATRITGAPVTSFSIGFGEPRFNEMEYARLAAKAFGSKHVEHFVQPDDVVRTMPILLESYDEPFGNASSVATYCCAKVAREHGVQVLYAGDGGDELFAGNERYAVQRVLDYYRRVPAWLRDPIVRPAVEALASTRFPLFVKGAKYVRRASIPYPDRLYSYDIFHLMTLDTILESKWVPGATQEHSHRALMGRYYREAPASDELDRQLYIDLKLTIGDNDVIKVVRATEAAGVTVRFPFLDARVAEIAGSVPARLKMRGTQLRSFFKRTYADFLPPETIAKTKHGFGLPIPVWLRSDPALHAMMRDLVLSPGSRIATYFQRSALETFVERHSTDPTTYYGPFLWNLMILELWLRGRASSRV
ncbi:MAG TPA: asparagine synthase-related protein [Candidatus Eisenbacteria bacterium]|jgi:asparagine synthase (glutamine-hydrolysing)|nr:asparagine synthase-related protein [Candidatus Eisenbacteria bacterium]